MRASAGRLAAGFAVGAGLLLAGCMSPAPSDSPESSATTVLPASGGVDYQLGGASALPDGVSIVARDATSSPEANAFSICYVNGFQTQPGALDAWLVTAPDGILRGDDVEPVVDPEWPDEFVLDSSTPEGRAAVLTMIEPSIAECAEKGFDAVEFDNLDTFTRFDGLTEAGTVELATRLTALVHDAGLVAGQKNTVELAPRGREIGFDFVIVEECLATEECDQYADAYGGDVIDVEYSLEPSEFAEICSGSPNPRLTILRDPGLVPASDPEYLYVACGG